MKRYHIELCVLHIPLALILAAVSLPAQKTKKAPPPAAAAAVQHNDDGYTAQILKDTTEKFFLTELVDHLPASDTVPTPLKVMGTLPARPNHLTYSKDIYRYMTELEKSSKRVKIFSHGQDGRRPRHDAGRGVGRGEYREAGPL